MSFTIRVHHRMPLTFFSGFMSLIAPLMLNNGPAYAEWVKIYSFDDLGGFIAYVDPDTFRRKGNLAKMWQLVDLKMTKTLEGRSFLSIKRMDEYNCTEEQSRTLAFYQYAGQMGNGEVVYSNTDPDKWVPVMPGSFGEASWKAVCRKY